MQRLLEGIELTWRRVASFRLLALVATLAVSFTCLILLENERRTVTERELLTEAGPVTIYEIAGDAKGPLVFVTHGFAGSRQMMQYISRDLARSGFLVASFDFYGHGRNTELLSPDVSRIEGTTSQLVGQTQQIIREVRSVLGMQSGDFGLLGHSMATDIVIRAASTMADAKSIVAISMYSDAVTAQFPKNLLIISGQWEGRLRDVGLRLVRQVDADVGEGQTVSSGTVTRRAVSIPLTEHVAVLFSSRTISETREWFARTLKPGTPALPIGQGMGYAITGVLAGLTISFFLAASALPVSAAPKLSIGTRRFLVTLTSAALLASAAVAIAPSDVIGLSAIGTLIVFLSVWGIAQIAGVRGVFAKSNSLNVIGFLVLLVAGGAVFAFAMDRYAAAFVPTGERFVLWLALLPATTLFCVADRMMVTGAPLWRRAFARVIAVGILGANMMMNEGNFGLLFTVVPVLCLFYLVYGLMGRAVARRSGPLTAGVALGVILAWAIAASTPLFAVS